MRILFADPMDPERVNTLVRAGHDCVVQNLSGDELTATIAGFDALVVRSTLVSAATIEAADCLSLIVRAGAGVDTIDRAAASGAGIYLCNVPGRNAIAVAELTMGLLLAIDRGLADGAADLRAGIWDKARYSRATGVHGRTMAIVGLGDIGLAVAERAKAFGMTVVALDRQGRTADVHSRLRSIGIRLVETENELLNNADVVSLHVPRSANTTGMVDRDFLAKLPEGAIVLNTSRGEVVDETALLHVLDHRNFSAGLDVFADEPATSTANWSSRVARHPRVVGSHHIGASTAQAQAAVADGVLETIEAFERGEPMNCVNLVTENTGTSCLTIRHLDRVGVLAKVLLEISRGGLNVQQMENQVFEGGRAAVAVIAIDGDVSTELRHSLQAIEEVLAVAVTGGGHPIRPATMRS